MEEPSASGPWSTTTSSGWRRRQDSGAEPARLSAPTPASVTAARSSTVGLTHAAVLAELVPGLTRTEAKCPTPKLLLLTPGVPLATGTARTPPLFRCHVREE